MSFQEIRRIISSYLYLYSAILFIPFLIALYFQFRTVDRPHPQPHSTIAFIFTIAITFALAWFLGRKIEKVSAIIYRQREAIAAAVLIWILTPAIGALPFLFSGTLERFDQAYFEAASGFTTTGATVLQAKDYDPATGKEIPIQRTFPGIHPISYSFYGTVAPVHDPVTDKLLEGLDAVSPALLFWRSFMQWIGGLGIIVLFVALLPEIGLQGKFLFQTEASGPVKEGFKPRIKETALQLWAVYTILTVLEIAFLLVVDPAITLFDAVTLSFSTLSTGGFSIHNESVAYYRQVNIEWIILIFMILGSINFSLYYYVVKGKFYRLFDRELLAYFSILTILGGFVVYELWRTPQVAFDGEMLGSYSFTDALRIGLFQFVSIVSSTGFYVNQYDMWPYTIQSILLVAMYLGGMSGSTAGGMKTVRIQILFHAAKAKIESLFQPKIVVNPRLGSREIDPASSFSVFCFFFIAIAASAIGTILYIFNGVDPETAISLTACMVNNTGVAFKAAGTANSMAFLSPLATCISAFLMILGRLEYYAFLAILMPSFWKRF